jgi:manganese oxidase
MVGPVSHMGHGLQTGAGMQEGMGMLRQGNALAEEFGPALGRGLGVAADAERATSNLVAQAPAQHDHGQHASGGAMDFYPKDDPEKKKVPGYPQDMWMVMDEEFNHKPENYGLRKGWTGAMMGMMTLVRVVTPEMYAKIEELKKQAPPQQQKKKGGHQHNAG